MDQAQKTVIDKMADTKNKNLIGITERGDAALDLSWENWVFVQ